MLGCLSRSPSPDSGWLPGGCHGEFQEVLRGLVPHQCSRAKDALAGLTVEAFTTLGEQAVDVLACKVPKELVRKLSIALTRSF